MKELVFQSEEILMKYLSITEVGYKLLVDITYLGREVAFLGKLLGTNNTAQAEGEEEECFFHLVRG